MHEVGKDNMILKVKGLLNHRPLALMGDTSFTHSLHTLSGLASD